MGLVSELRRRNVLRMAVLYVVAAWLIMQVAEVIIGLANLPDWIGPAILGLLAIGFPIALIFSWFYELTAEGISLEKDVAPGESITHVTGRRLDFLVISLLCAAVILFAYDKWWMDGPPEYSIAVLPFENMSDDPGQEYFSDGISEEILNVLAKIPGLHVTSRSSAFTFKGKDVDIPTVAEQLGVANVLEGSVRKSGERIRISAQLIDAKTDKHLWSETYDRDLLDIFAVQDEISTAIVRALKEHLGLQVEVTPRVSATANTEAHDAYLRGRYLLVQRTQAALEGAVREFEGAIALDPNYALAHAELSVAIAIFDTPTPSAKAVFHAEQAMALDSTLAEAHAATGLILRQQWKLEEALTHCQRAIQINPNYAIAYTWMGIALGSQGLGRYDEAFKMGETALRLDPLSLPAITNRSLALRRMNRPDEAEREVEKLASIAPAKYASWRGDLYYLGGNWAQVALGYLDSVRIDPEGSLAPYFLPIPFALLGLEKEALAISEDPSPRVLRILGRPEDAVAAAESRLEGRGRDLMELGLALASAGEYARAGPILEEMWQRSSGVIAFRSLFQPASAAALIAIRREAGDEAGVNELVAAIRDNVRRYHEAGITRADESYSVDYEMGIADYLSGERERGLALIAKSVEDGWFIRPNEAYLQALYDDPGFAPVRASQEAHQAREREEFLAVVCTDNPYAAVWQPAEGTCERYAATVGN